LKLTGVEGKNFWGSGSAPETKTKRIIRKGGEASTLGDKPQFLNVKERNHSRRPERGNFPRSSPGNMSTAVGRTAAEGHGKNWGKVVQKKNYDAKGKQPREGYNVHGWGEQTWGKEEKRTSITGMQRKVVFLGEKH